MPTPMMCDEAMANQMAPAVSASVALRCRKASLGERIIWQYDCIDIYKGKLQREQFLVNLFVMKTLVPVVTGTTYHQKTVEKAAGVAQHR